MNANQMNATATMMQPVTIQKDRGYVSVIADTKEMGHTVKVNYTFEILETVKEILSKTLCYKAMLS